MNQVKGGRVIARDLNELRDRYASLAEGYGPKVRKVVEGPLVSRVASRYFDRLLQEFVFRNSIVNDRSREMTSPCVIVNS